MMGFSLKIKMGGSDYSSFRDAVNSSSIERQVKVLEEVENHYVKVGILKDNNDRKEFTDSKGNTLVSTDGNMTVALVGAFQEYGTRTGIPRRSFLRDPIRDGMPKINKVAQKYIKKALSEELEPSAVLDMIGEYAKGLSVLSFRKNDWKPNSSSTIQAKGSSAPLISTGQLRQSINYEVIKGSPNNED